MKNNADDVEEYFTQKYKFKVGKTYPTKCGLVRARILAFKPEEDDTIASGIVSFELDGDPICTAAIYKNGKCVPSLHPRKTLPAKTLSFLDIIADNKYIPPKEFMTSRQLNKIIKFLFN